MSFVTSPLPKGLQILESHSADLEECLWSFRLGYGDHVTAGTFAVLPYDNFTEMNVRLQEAETLLNELLVVGPISPKHKAMVERFFDPKPLG